MILPPALASGINNALSMRITASKFDYKQRDDQKTAVLQKLRQLLTEAHARMERGQADLTAALGDRAELVERERAASERCQELEKLAATLESDTGRLKNLARKVQKSYVDTKAALMQRESELSSATTNLTVLETRLAELSGARTDSSQRLRDTESQLAATRDKLRSEEEAASALRAQLAEKDAELSRTLAMFSTAQGFHQDSAAKLQAQVQELTEGKHQAELDLRDCKAELANLRASLQSTKDTLSSASTDRATLLSDRDAATKAVATLQVQLDDLRARYAETAAQLQAVQSELSATAAALAVEKEGREHESRGKGEAQERAVSLHNEIIQVKEQLMAALTETSAVRQELARAKEDWSAQREALKDSLAAEKDKMQQRMTAAEDKWAAERASIEERTTAERCRFETEAKVVREELRQVRESRDGLIKAAAEKDMELERVTVEAMALRRNVGTTQEASLETICALELENKRLQTQVSSKEELLNRLEEHEQTIKDLRAQMAAGEVMRRRMHNQIQELKGNIRVLGRVRPFLPHDAETEYSTLECCADEKSIRCHTERSEKPYAFTFDRVMPPTATQAHVFEEVAHLVQSALDGYNVCLFSYGQTGSGKTHTMSGGRGADAGIIPRSVAKIIETVAQYKQQGWSYTLEAAFSEIYNDKLIDLLNDNGQDVALDIRRENNRTSVPGLTRVPISSCEAVDKLVAQANRNRSTATTDMNERSSRSHLVFTMYLKGVNHEQRVQLEGTLNLCDLAGSERLDRSRVVGDRLKETQAINKSLSSLSDVFIALSKGSPHVPFRNSRLTYLLQDCFAGDGKTMMVVNLSPTTASASESLCSLRFASTVSQVHLGTAKKHIQKTSGDTNTYDESTPMTDDAPEDLDTTASFSAPASAAAAAAATAGGAATGGAVAAAAAAAPFRKRALAQTGPSYAAPTSRVRTGAAAAASAGAAAGSRAGTAVGTSGIKRPVMAARK